MDFRKHLCGFTYIDILIQPYIQINITQTQQSHTRAHTHTHTHTHTHIDTHTYLKITIIVWKGVSALQMQTPTFNPTPGLNPDRDKSLKHTQTIPWLLSVKSLNEFGNAVLSGIKGNKNFKSTKVKNVYIYNWNYVK